jgi:pentafunctional AROM polypeptide
LITSLYLVFSQIDSIFVILEGYHQEADHLNNIRQACKYDFFLPDPQAIFYKDLSLDEYESIVLKRFLHFLQKVSVPRYQSNDLARKMGQWSHFLSLTYPSIDDAVPQLPELRKGIDAYELRVDLLSNITDFSIQRQLALLYDFSPLPVVYTVRTIGQLGRFPLEPADPIIKLLEQGLRASVEYLDVEACLPSPSIDQITSRAIINYCHRSMILGSLHVTTPQSKEEIESLIGQCNLHGKADILKVVTGARNDEDCDLIKSFSTNRYNKPYIGLCLGESGTRSRVLNERFTPVTHKLMAKAAPGQLSAEELMMKRASLGLTSSKKYYLFGTPIKQSMSPAMHNSAFGTLLLPHEYQLIESEDVSIYENVINQPGFGGASVTIPHKETIMPMLDEVVGAARDIGAVNTIVIRDGKKIGYNTDWLGMIRPIERLMQRGSENADYSKFYGVVLGAGGTAKAACYAIKQLGLKLVICNRTPEKSQDIAVKYDGISISLENLAKEFDPSLIKVIIGTIPGKAEVTVPAELLTNRPIVLDAVYKPPRTKLIQQAIDAGCPVIQGATMLLEQGVEQFELWQQRSAPKEEMEAAVFQGIEKLS